MKPVRVGIVGLGWGQLQIESFRRVRGVEIAAVCDQNIARANELASRYKIARACDDAKELMQLPDVDLVSIATPPETQNDLVRAAIHARKHVLCEKPLGVNVRDAESVLALAREHALVHALDFEMRFLPALAYAKELIDEEYLGVLHRVDVTMTLEQPWGHEHGNWAADDARGGGILAELGLHFFDILRWWFGDVVAVLAERQTHFATIKRAKEKGDGIQLQTVTGDDAFWCVLRFARSGQARVNFVSGARHDPGWTMSAYGSSGTLVVQGGGLLGRRDGDREMAILPIPKRLELGDNPRDPLMWSMVKLFERVVAKINHAPDAKPFPDFHDGVQAARIVHAIRCAAQEKKWVDV
ncbi:MAG: Gfo/Idh/MocA family oxidoreductase [Chloroflexi bacterium]|nr:Gfo/Idh/MocA family oxidoreductase [Chloroflexota bacterium]